MGIDPGGRDYVCDSSFSGLFASLAPLERLAVGSTGRPLGRLPTNACAKQKAEGAA